MKRRKRPDPEPRTCLTHGCGATIAGWKWLCDHCFKALPFDRRKAIAEAGQAKARHQVGELARAGAAWLERHGPAAEAARRIGEAAE